ncbi:hypothetical protein SADUNF_Sadunf07G0046900 [Salix dunnii]|uniref:Uncharacterized protein n=1 Tax=Salix dunnii TaxID=1413687 RepID=A0A835JW53_9ROSI|nr:hypothetical protein SADUNF_Sadunf07G0046900 [Salix dunnii]
MTSITSVELNYLVFRYLQESGFTHSAFVLGYEAGINKCTIDGNMVPPGALITFIQKGLQYLEMEANLSNQSDNTNSRMITDTEVKHEENGISEGNFTSELLTLASPHASKVSALVPCDNTTIVKFLDLSGPEPMDICTASKSQTCEIPSSDVMILEGHTSEVCACAWSPTGSLLASGTLFKHNRAGYARSKFFCKYKVCQAEWFIVVTGFSGHYASICNVTFLKAADNLSGDSTARIWKIAEGTSRSVAQNGPFNVLVLNHVKGRTNEKSKDVTTLDWNGEGTLLATGSYDGQARIWSTDGDLKTTLSKHKGPIFTLKWNKKGDYLLTGSCDKTAIVWDVRAEEWKQQFEFHTGPTLDVDWRNNVSFATSSTDNMIYVCKVGETRPIKTFAGHQGEVNCVKWDPTGSWLASCSDDISAKIWSMKQDKYVHDLREHSKEIYTIRWSPTGPGTNNPNQQLVLASASFDSTVKLWDVEFGKLLCSLDGHREPVYSVAFSPNGEYLASGSLDRCINIWSLREGKIVKTYAGNGGIFEVCWNKEGDKIAACFANNTVCVLDFRM